MGGDWGTAECLYASEDPDYNINHLRWADKVDHSEGGIIQQCEQPSDLDGLSFIALVPSVESEFTRLSSIWHRETGLSSRLDEKVRHWAYRQIIRMDAAVVPFILRDLERRPDHWFWALILITGENPGDQADDMRGAASAWISWGKDKGYLTD